MKTKLFHSIVAIVAMFAFPAGADKYPGILDSFEKFPGESGDSVAGYRGDDRQSSWTVSGNAIVIKNDGTAYDGRNYLRIQDLTSAQHHATKTLDADYMPEVFLYSGGDKLVTFSFAYRFQMTDETAATPSLNMKADFHDAVAGTYGATGAFNIFAAPNDIVEQLRALTNVWIRVDGDLRYCMINNGATPRLLLHALTITDTRIDPATGAETVLWTSASETGYWRDKNNVGYKQFSKADEMHFFLHYFNFFTGGSGHYIADIDAIRIGDWHDPTTVVLFR